MGSPDALDHLRRLAAAQRTADLGRLAADRGRLSVRQRLARVRSRSFQIGQCAVGALAAWLVATRVVGHDQPFFAPVAAVVGLGLTYGNRLTRVAEVVLGVAVGVGVGDLLVSVLGAGAWQLALVVAVAMTVAAFLGAGTVLTTQAGVQACIVTTLLPDPGAGLNRWVDAVVGGAVALLIAAVVPGSPLRRPRRLMAATLTDVHDLLLEAALSLAEGDPRRADLALDRARAGQASFAVLEASAAEGLDVVRLSPLRRRHRPDLEVVAARLVPLDRAVRNLRVLLRRAAVAARRGDDVPPGTVELLRDLAAAVEVLARSLDDGSSTERALPLLESVARGSATVPVGLGLSSDVVLAQTRAMVVDLLQVAGRDADSALRAVPPEAGHR